MHTWEMHAHKMHACKMHAFKTYACKMHAGKIYVCKMHLCKMHACKVDYERCMSVRVSYLLHNQSCRQEFGDANSWPKSRPRNVPYRSALGISHSKGNG